MELSETQQRAEELFAEGNQFLAQKYYKMTADLLFKLGRQEEGQIYLEMAAEINQTSDTVAKLTDDLEQKKNIGDYENVLVLYIELIEHSKQINDSNAVEMFQSDIIQLIRNNKVAIEDLEQALQTLTKMEISLDKSFKLEEAKKIHKKSEILSTVLGLLGNGEEFAKR